VLKRRVEPREVKTAERYAALSSESSKSVRAEGVFSFPNFIFRRLFAVLRRGLAPAWVSSKSQSKTKSAPTAPTRRSSRYATAMTKEAMLNTWDLPLLRARLHSSRIPNQPRFSNGHLRIISLVLKMLGEGSSGTQIVGKSEATASMAPFVVPYAFGRLAPREY